MKNRELWGAALGAVLAFGAAGAAHAEFTSVKNAAWINTSLTETTLVDNEDTDIDLPNIFDITVEKKTTGSGPYTPGVSGSNVVTFGVAITNNSSVVDMPGLTFQDDPIGTGAGISASWTCTSNNNASTFCQSGSGTGAINWTNLTLLPSESVTIFMQVTLSALFQPNGPDTCKGLYNLASVTQNYQRDVDMQGTLVTPYSVSPDDDQASVCVEDINNEGGKLNLIIKKDDGIKYYTPGTSSTYVIRAWNEGPADLPGNTATLRDTLPAGVFAVGAIVCEVKGTPGAAPSIVSLPVAPITPSTSQPDASLSVDITSGLLASPGSANADFSTTFPTQWIECSIPVTWSTDMSHYQ